MRPFQQRPFHGALIKGYLVEGVTALRIVIIVVTAAALGVVAEAET